jgi:hypothetical protein
MLRDVLNLAFGPFSLAARRAEGLVLTGTVDEVRKLVRFAKLLRVRGLEIVGYERPENPSCAFISQLPKLQYVRLFAGALKDIESVQSLPRLRYLAILYTTKHQPITIDFVSLSALERVELQWFEGAEAIFKARQIRSLHLLDCPFSSSDLFVKLDRLISLRLSVGNLIDTRGFSRLSSLRWLGLLDQKELRDFGGLSGLASLGFLWIEACPNLKNIEWLAGMRQLETLRIIDCGEVTGIKVLRSLPRLRHVHIHGSTKVASGDLAFLRSLPNLDSVVVKHLPEGEVAYWAQRNKRYNLLRSDLLGG